MNKHAHENGLGVTIQTGDSAVVSYVLEGNNRNYHILLDID